MLRHIAQPLDAGGLVGGVSVGRGGGHRLGLPILRCSFSESTLRLTAGPPTISASNPSVSRSSARMSARISSSGRNGWGL